VEERARREPLPSERRAVLSAATRHLARIAALALCACWAGIASAERLAPADVPEPLRPWIRWALGENDDALCPVLESRGPACAWPGRLSLDVGDAGGTFALRLQADRAELFHLPGGGEIWPEDVTVDGKPVPVVGSHDSGQPPAVRIEVGAHEIRSRRSSWCPSASGSSRSASSARPSRTPRATTADGSGSPPAATAPRPASSASSSRYTER
jgi:hypothetical protein